MTEWIPDTFVNADGDVKKADVIDGYNLLMVVYSASWWGGCAPFKASLKKYYETWNKEGKALQVVIISGDQNEDGSKQTTDGMPWIALKFGADKTAFEQKIPCTGYPTPGVINLKNGSVIEADAFGKVNESSCEEWTKKMRGKLISI